MLLKTWITALLGLCDFKQSNVHTSRFPFQATPIRRPLQMNAAARCRSHGVSWLNLDWAGRPFIGLRTAAMCLVTLRRQPPIKAAERNEIVIDASVGSGQQQIDERVPARHVKMQTTDKQTKGIQWGGVWGAQPPSLPLSLSLSLSLSLFLYTCVKTHAMHKQAGLFSHFSLERSHDAEQQRVSEKGAKPIPIQH